MEEFKYSIVIEPKVNYALILNKYSIIKEIKIKNNLKDDMELIIDISADFINSYSSSVKIKGKKELVLEKIPLVPKVSYFKEVIENELSTLSVNIHKKDEEGKVEYVNVDILPFNHWNGYKITPEITSAYVTPNDPYVGQIIDNGTEILKRIDADPAFCGYQANSKNQVLNQANAIYTALLNKNITYINPPASFGEIGQKIFTVEQILNQRMGTCFDLAILYASCLERCGLHPIIVLMAGHAFCGLWLVDDYFDTSVNWDLSAIHKRVKLNEMAFVETTALTRKVDFLNALNEGINNFSEMDFICSIDIYTTRTRGIVPISGKNVILKSNKEDINNEAHKVEIDEREFINNKPVIKDKIDLWSRKLLDLGMRNKLINFNLERHGLPLLVPNLPAFEDSLIMDKEYEILDEIVVESKEIGYDIDTFINESFKNGKLLTDPKIDIKKTLGKLYRENKIAMEEMGSNNFFLAIGFLRWFESESSKTPRYAPILLLNMEIKKTLSGYKIKRGELETQMNITLTEMLRREFGIEIGDLARDVKDEHGADVYSIFNIIRKAIIDKPNWDVVENVSLGNFSFNKFVLWQDLQNRKEDIKNHPITGGLVKGYHVWSEIDEKELNESSLDYKFNPANLLCPVSYDSSQLLAVALTDMGKSFILHGAPGTGKSQTITNIIANAMGKGKSVLFVAEKKAALDVVQNRLEKIGLEPFCLELHSDKSNKANVMEQFQNVLNKNKIEVAPLENATKKMQIYKNNLNTYVNALHFKRPIGCSLYEIITKLIEMKEVPSPLTFSTELVDELTLGHFKAWEEKIDIISSVGKLCEPIKDNPWKDCNISEYNVAIKEEILRLFDKVLENIDILNKNTNEVCDIFKISNEFNKKENYSKLLDLIDKINELPIDHANYITEDLDEIKKDLNQLSDKINIRNSKLSEIENKYIYSVLDLDFNELYNIQVNSEKKNIFSKFRKKESAVDILNKFAKIEIKSENIYKKINELKEYKELENYILIQQENIFGSKNINFEEIKNVLEKIKEIKQLLFEFVGISRLNEALTSIKEVVKNKELLGKNYLIDLKNKIEEPLNVIISLEEKLLWNVNCGDKKYTDYISEEISVFKNNILKLQNWADWKKVTIDKEKYYLTELIDLYENGRIENSNLKEQFFKSIYQAYALNEISKVAELRGFSRPIFEEIVNHFKTLNKEIESITKVKIIENLIRNKPKMDNDTNAGEYSILTREIAKKRNSKPIRALLKDINHILPKLKPCMLMSPMSVAQYLDKDASFDLVIFDEASQISTCDAIGAISRGKSVVIVGDPKQMPPTSFFNSSDSDELSENSEVEKDLESILEDCLAINIPSCFLKWHYRSKHEDLIAYSNFRYYDNNMMTFPAVSDTEKFVRFVPIHGYYDHGHSRTNEAEAIAIVKEVKRRLEHEKLREKSIGVVTFSMAQQVLIENKMDEMLSQNPHLDVLYNNPSHGEPVFIKNLENVQGDERDVILFSICYGPDKNGKLSMNFGPLNKDGGQRRLNVAISRARYEMIVFSTLDPDQIDLRRTESLGVRDLKEFMDFAKYGKEKLEKLAQNDKNNQKFIIENKIAEELRAKGYIVHTQIGFSGFRIDMAILDPDSKRYVLGIACDGESYKSGKTAKDRNIARNSVLEMLGWNIHRVWIQDYWNNPNEEIDRIIKSYNELKANLNYSFDKNELSYDASEFPFTWEGDEAESNNEEEIEEVKEEEEVEEKEKEKEEEKEEEAKDVEEEAVDDEIFINIKEYEIIDLPIRSEDFYDSDNYEIIKEQISQIIDFEAPILEEYLLRRVKDLWGFKQLGKNIREQLLYIMKSMKLSKKKEAGIITYWGNLDSNNYNDFRFNNRNIEDIPICEIENAITCVVNEFEEIDRDFLISETAHKLGFAKTGQKIKEIVDDTISRALRNKKISRIGRSTTIIKFSE